MRFVDLMELELGTRVRDELWAELIIDISALLPDRAVGCRFEIGGL